MVKTIRTDSKF